jgi:tetratricopeptide (TPR) repeat protein
MGVLIKGFENDNLKQLLNPAENTGVVNEKAYRHCIKADALRIKNYYFESIDEYLNALDFDSNNADAYRGLGISYRHVGYIDNAIEVFHRARKLAPFDKTIYYELGSCYIAKKKPCPAIKSLITAIKLDPMFIDAQFKLAVVHEMIDEDDIAELIYSKIIEVRPSYVAAYNNLGSLYIKLQRHYEAIKMYRRLIRINPDFNGAYLGLAVAYDKAGRTHSAVKYYKKYAELKPNANNIIYVDNRLKHLKNSKTPTAKRKFGLISCE